MLQMDITEIIDSQLSVLSILSAIIMVTATTVFIRACKKQRELRIWLPFYILITGSLLITAITSYINVDIDIFSNILYIIGCLFLFVGIYLDYYRSFIKVKVRSLQNHKISKRIAVVSPAIIGMQGILMLFAIFNLFLLIRIYLKKKSPTYAFLCLSLLCAILSIFVSLLKSTETVETGALTNGLLILFVTMLLVTGFVAILEEKIKSARISLENVLKTASDATINVANIATELAAGTNEVNASAEEIVLATQQVSHDTQKAMESSNEISNIMDIITNISNQTNLLALNASIEAGRAGEIGKGFGVVANEVRKLAEESKSAVINTTEKVHNVIVNIQRANSSMEEINASSEQQSASIEEISSVATKLGALIEDLKVNLLQSTELK